MDSFHKYIKNKDLIKGMLDACNRVLDCNGISDSRKETILHEYSGISHNQKFVNDTTNHNKTKTPNIILKNLINDLKNNILPFINMQVKTQRQDLF